MCLKLNNKCVIFIFSIGACTFSMCSFVVFESAAVAHGIIAILIKIDILFYEHHVQAHICEFWCHFIHS